MIKLHKPSVLRVDAYGQPLRKGRLYQILNLRDAVGFAWCDQIPRQKGEGELIAHEFYSSGSGLARCVQDTEATYFKRYKPVASFSLRRVTKLVKLKQGVDFMAYMFKVLCEREIGETNTRKIEDYLKREEINAALKH